MRYATLHSWGLALVQYTRSKIEDISIPNINYCKIMLCYWLVLSTYYVDFLKYFTSFNKSFDNSFLSNIPLKESIFSISLRSRHREASFWIFKHFLNTGLTSPIINTLFCLKTLKCFVIFKRQINNWVFTSYNLCTSRLGTSTETDQKKNWFGQNWRTNITDRKIGFPCLHFTIKVFTDFCCFSSMSNFFTFSMWDYKGQWHQKAKKISLILF